jgi:two-component system response regulator AtoC
MTPSATVPGKVLMVEDDKNFAAITRKELERLGFEVQIARGAKEALSLAGADDFDVILLDLRLGSDSGLEILARLRDEGADAEVIVLTGHGTIESAVEAMRQGAREYLTKPCNLSELDLHVRKALHARRLRAENRGLKEYLARGPNIPVLASSEPTMKAVLDALPKVAASDVPVLVLGESGTGKELIARQLHALSPLASQPFLTLNCAALNEEILESELFGHEKGSFTGATRKKLGLFEIASGGTIFLDEIGDIAEGIQAKLLRVLQFGEIRRVGGTENLHVQVRVIAATNKDLDAAVAERRFRQDLFFRLNVVTLTLPALRQRPQDIEPIFRSLLARLRPERTYEISPGALRCLRTYSWPGNIRELENVARRILIFHDIDIIDEAAIRAVLPHVESKEDNFLLSLEELERRHILRTLMACHNDKPKAAEILQVSLKTLYNKLHVYGEQGKSLLRPQGRGGDAC